jgi:hypothetical protein
VRTRRRRTTTTRNEKHICGKRFILLSLVGNTNAACHSAHNMTTYTSSKHDEWGEREKDDDENEKKDSSTRSLPTHNEEDEEDI